MKVSVVIPAYNQAEYLKQALSSALSQTHQNLEVLVVDDGSTDQTATVCQAIDDPRLVYIHQANDGTKGLGARNAGLLAATGEWIALLDQDDLWASTKIEMQLRRAAECPGVGAVFCRVRFVDERGEVTGEQPDDLPEGEVFHDLLEHNRYYAASGMFRRDLMKVSGLPDESCGFADWALWVGIARHAPVAVVREALADYRTHSHSFLAQMSQAGDIPRYEAHLTTLVRNATRAHVGCEACRLAIRQCRKSTAKPVLRIARRLAGDGHFAVLPRAVKLAWRAAPFWLGMPWTAFGQASRMLTCMAVGGVRRLGRPRKS